MACFEAGLNKLKVILLFSHVLCRTKLMVLGKGLSHPRYEWDDASHLDLHVPLPGILINFDIEDRITAQKLLSP
jgi:hypothetical protein